MLHEDDDVAYIMTSSWHCCVVSLLHSICQWESSVERIAELLFASFERLCTRQGVRIQVNISYYTVLYYLILYSIKVYYSYAIIYYIKVFL